MASISDAEIIELENLLLIQERFDALNTLNKNTNPNLRFLKKAIDEQEWGFDDNGKPVILNGFAGVGLEGSSRSGKTWSGVDLIIWLSTDKHAEEGCVINIYRETYNEFKTTLYPDFDKRLDYYGLPNKFKGAEEVKSFRIGKTKINFLGDGKHGGSCDYAFYNEVMMIKQNVFDQSEMRCRIFWWADFNPSFTHHWFFESVENRKNVGMFHTTFKDNLEHISPNELSKILSYEPWEPDSYCIEDHILMYQGKEIEENHQPPPHLENTESGSADESMWRIYGLGLRGAMKGVILSRIKYIKEWPSHLPFTYGLDFGFTADPTALVRYAKEGPNIYVELLIYTPIDNSEDLNDLLIALGVSKNHPITADSADRYLKSGKEAVYMVNDLFEEGWEITKVSKTKRIVYWLNKLKKDVIHVVINDLSHHYKTEQQNYKWKEVNGIMINQPIDGFDHAITATRYARMADEFNNIETTWN